MVPQKNIIPFLKDMQFGAAFAAAPVVWELMLWIFPPSVILGQALTAPERLLMLAVAYPVLEEIVFRGGLQGWLRSRGWGLHTLGPLTLANGLTSLLFTALHFLSHPPLAAAMVFVPSLVFGYFRDRTDADPTHGLGAPIVLHCWYNAGYFLIFGM